MTSKEIIAVLEEATQANISDPFRQGNVVALPGPGDVVMSGDLHDHHRNFDKLVLFSKLVENPNRHLIIHELIHGNETKVPGQCHSFELIYKAAQLKLQYPRQVHYLMGNHAMAQITRDEVLKNGQAMVRAFNAGILAAFGSNAEHVSQVLEDFLMSLPIAARTDNRVWMSHSLPSARYLSDFDQTIFEHKISQIDIANNPSLHALIWNRVHTEKSISLLQEMLDVDMFIVGHKPQPDGYKRLLPELIILASDHNHGCFLPFPLGKIISPDDLESNVRPLAGVV